MKRATSFMVEKVSTRGGYVWSYLPDMSRRWGEIEAKPSMIWVQPPGTATMGHLFLDAYHATGDEYYYQAAEKVGGALIRGQHRSGGWNYFIDFAGPSSTKHWYETIGKNAWRMEEFQHYADNATFDDMGTSESAQFLLRLYLEKQDPKYRPALERAVNFVLDSQYPSGGWPQRWPYDPGYPAYQSYITFNDDVAAENVKFLTMVYRHLGDTRALDAIHRGMNIYLLTQQGAPQAGWALQYTLDLKPAAARSYEPNALHTATTASNVEPADELLPDDRRPPLPRPHPGGPGLAGIGAPSRAAPGPQFPDLRRDRHQPADLRPPPRLQRRQRRILLGLQPGSDARPLFRLPQRRRSEASAPNMRRCSKTSPAELAKSSPLLAPDPEPLPRYFVSGGMVGSDLNAGDVAASPARADPLAQRPGLVADPASRDQQPVPRATAPPSRLRRLSNHPCRRPERHLALHDR